VTPAAEPAAGRIAPAALNPARPRSTDGKKTITHIDSVRLTWLLIACFGGIGLFFFRWPIAGFIIPKSTSEQAAPSNGG